ncbi:MAG: hypothetical protein HY927_12240 [Elusimicrobia bacterium]|nr:hypothetical protein [Elusimicrobiota bacterium]
MIGRAKWIFWGLVLASFAILAVPSVELLGALRSYYRFLTGYDPGTLRPTRMVSFQFQSPLDRDRPAGEEPRLSFVEFRLAAPKAKAVLLAGDFTRWEDGGMPMHKRSGGIWELLVPLPAGRYRYLFLVDGAPTLDPKNPEIQPRGGRPASAKTVSP